MKLLSLLRNKKELLGTLKGNKGINITGITANSKLVIPGNLFISKPSPHAEKYLHEAIHNGSIAILTTQWYPQYPQITQIIASNISQTELDLVLKYYGKPSEELLMIGITGTSGKTTTSILLQQLLDRLGYPSGLIGTLRYSVGKQEYPAPLTTPDLPTTQKLLREMAENDQRCCVMEVSSHSLDQDRVAGINFDIAIFTNISHDHLDYHKTLDAYIKAKSKLFSSLIPKPKKHRLCPKVAIVNLDDPQHIMMTRDCLAKVFTYGLSPLAHLSAHNVKTSLTGTQFELQYGNQKCTAFTKLLGEFNLYNLLATIATLIHLGFSLSDIEPHIEHLNAVEGRLQSIKNSLGLHIFVDYAHKPDPLEKILLLLKKFIQRCPIASKLWVVFGCGGNRDHAKRPMMGKIAQTYADQIILTADNSRNEPLEEILHQICQGLSPNKKNYILIHDRKEAINHAIAHAKPGDIILIAGKGHETYQIVGQQTFLFDDCQIAEEACKAKSEELIYSTPLQPL
jgi:UDP-N-acetylmuramoyl-L-alanyl-D-glutamate--2,6-diaminopimelate ligase